MFWVMVIFNLDSSVVRIQVCGLWVRSRVTHWVRTSKTVRANKHASFRQQISSQLRNLGLSRHESDR